MEAVGLRLPAWLDRGSDLRAAVSLPVQLRTSRLEGRVNTPSHWTDTCMLMSSCRPPAPEGASDWSPALANGVVTGRGKRRGGGRFKGQEGAECSPNMATRNHLSSIWISITVTWVSFSLSRLRLKCPLANVLTPFSSCSHVMKFYVPIHVY